MTIKEDIGFLLDLDKPEYDDLFITSTDERELWQRDAMYSLVDKLKINLTSAKKYGKQREKERKKTNLSHNSIFLTGERGSGKTAFLRNIESIWIHKNKQGLENDIGFLELIDPTMLMNNDSFANVVVAEIYRKVEEHNLDNNVSSTDRAAFYNALKSLSDSLGKQDEFNGHSGVDKILRYNSGIQVEQNFHRYVEEALKILSCSALVLPIDDVDMSLQKAHEVIDDVRRLLGCPYIIPIVSGDVALYQQMINVDFDDRAYKKDSDDDLKRSGVELARDLSDEYLKKVFPAQMRLPLNNIARVMNELKVKEGEKERAFSDYQDSFYHMFYFLLHNQYVMKTLPTPQTARELTQLVRSFNLINTKKNTLQWSMYRSFCESQKDGEGYVNALSYLVAQSRRYSPSFSLKELPAFNPLLQLGTTYSWADKLVTEDQLDAFSKLSNNENEKFIKSAFNGKDKALTSVPPYELFSEKFNISQRLIRSEDNNKKKVLLSIYASNAYYSTMSNSAHCVFVGRAFEIIVLSFVNNGVNLTSQLERIVADIPLHSIFSLDGKKHVEINEEYDDEDVVVESESANELTPWLSSEIEVWKKNNKAFFSQVDGLSLIPIFSKIFNQVFTQINLLKVGFKGKAYEGETLNDFARRFEHIFVNSALMNVSDINVVKANTSLTKNHKTIRDYSEFSKRDRTLVRNYENLINSNGQDNIRVQFIDTLWDHPIFKINNSRGMLDSYYPLGKQSNTQRADQVNEAELQETIERLEIGIVNNVALNHTDWSFAKKLVDRLINDLAISGELKEIEAWIKNNKEIAMRLNNIFDINGYFNYLSSANESKSKRFLSAIRVI